MAKAPKLPIVEPFPPEVPMTSTTIPENIKGALQGSSLPPLVAGGFVAGAVVPDHTKVDATTLTFLIYMLYKLNILTRIQVRDYLDIVKTGKHPDDTIAYLMAEVKKI